MEAERDREMVEVIVKKIEAEEKAEQEQYLRSRYETIPRVGFVGGTKPGECRMCFGGAALAAGIRVPSNRTRYPPATFFSRPVCSITALHALTHSLVRCMTGKTPGELSRRRRNRERLSLRTVSSKRRSACHCQHAFFHLY